MDNKQEITSPIPPNLKITDHVLSSPNHLVRAVQLTEENMAEAALWCSGEVVYDEEEVPLRIYVPLLESHDQPAEPGDFLVHERFAAGPSFRVYSEGTFKRSYIEVNIPRTVESEKDWETAPYATYEGSGGSVVHWRHSDMTLFDSAAMSDPNNYPFHRVDTFVELEEQQ